MHVFVYGSLKRGHGNHRCLEGAEFVGPGILDNAKMLNLGAFPGLVPAPPGAYYPVFGEVYKITPEILARLDRLEGHPDFYCRSMEDIWQTMEQNCPVWTAWVYFLSKDSAEHYSKLCDEIPSGQWK